MHVTGKWFNYGIIFIVMILDLNMWKNQIFYDPFTFGQYTDSSGYIYTVSNTTFVKYANKTTLSYKWRWNNINPLTNRTYGKDDFKMNSKYLDFSLGVKGLAFVPSIAAFIVFGLLVWFYGRDEAVTVVPARSQVDGIVVDQWEYEEKESDKGMMLNALFPGILRHDARDKDIGRAYFWTLKGIVSSIYSKLPLLPTRSPSRIKILQPYV